MKSRSIILVISMILPLSCAAQSDQPAPYRPFKGEYVIYAGELGDQQAPTSNDRKLSFIVEGAPAKEIFEAMGRDDKHACGMDEGTRSRSRGNVWCTFHPGEGYACYFGFDLRTGKSIPGGTC